MTRLTPALLDPTPRADIHHRTVDDGASAHRRKISRQLR